jgi:hypothetical protein
MDSTNQVYINLLKAITDANIPIFDAI